MNRRPGPTMRAVTLAALVCAPLAAWAAGGDLGPTRKQPTNWTAIGMFALFVVATLFITKWAASRTKSAADFYTAGGGITGFQNGLAIAASANFPVLFLSLLWKDCTTRGAVIGGFLGLISSVVLTILSPSVWEATLGNPKGSAAFPYTSPALFSMTIGFLGIWLFSILDRSDRARLDRSGFLAQKVRSETGIGAAKASAH